MLAHKEGIKFSRHCQTFLKWVYDLASPPAMYESSGCSSSLSALNIVNLFDFRHFSGYQVILKAELQ